MKTGIIIQARMGSTRLPNKVLKKLAGKEVLWHVVERCQKSRMADAVIVATSTDVKDDVIYQFCLERGIEFFRGSENNVLDRFYQCAKKFNLDVIVRVTADCPLVDPFIIDQAIKLFLEKKEECDYVSNIFNRVFPRGLDCEVFSFSALEEAVKEAESGPELENVTPYIIKNKRTLLYQVEDPYCGDFRLTLDVQEDFDVLNQIYDKFYKEGSIIDAKKAIKFLKDNPEVARINSAIEQKSSAEKEAQKK
jgi:spore coat polysaccharide biosynthesis protein SpsF